MKGVLQIVMWLLVTCSECYAQLDSTYSYSANDSIPYLRLNPDPKRQVDAGDIFNEVFNSGEPSKKPDVTEKRRYYFSCLPAAAYTTQTKFVVLASTNIAFYRSETNQDHLSVINFTVNYTQKHQIIMPILTNIWSKDNNYNFQGNWTFYRYPDNTYGLGGYYRKRTADPIFYKYILVREAALKRIYGHLFTGLGYALDVHSNIKELQNQSAVMTDFEKYGKTSKSVSSGLTLNILYDQRKNPINPPKGFYGNIVFRPNYTFLGSDQNWQSLLVDLRTYIKLSENTGNVLAFWSYNLFTVSGKPPYLDLPSNGWDNNSTQGRGYIQSRFRGKNLISFETEYRFRVLNNGLLGGVLFSGVEGLPSWPGNRITSILPTAGAGIRIKINKHSNTNLAIDYGFGRGRSQGLFINLGEAF